MKLPLARKILDEHIVDGIPETGREVGLRIDQTLTQDATGTMAAPGRPSAPYRRPRSWPRQATGS